MFTLLPIIITKYSGRYGQDIEQIIKSMMADTFGVLGANIDGTFEAGKDLVINLVPNMQNILRPMVNSFCAFKPIWIPASTIPSLLSWYILWKAFNNLGGRNGNIAQTFKIIRYLQHKINTATEVIT